MCTSTPKVPKDTTPNIPTPTEADAEAIAKREMLERQKRVNLYGRPSTILTPMKRPSLLGSAPTTTKPLGG